MCLHGGKERLNCYNYYIKDLKATGQLDEIQHLKNIVYQLVDFFVFHFSYLKWKPHGFLKTPQDWTTCSLPLKPYSHSVFIHLPYRRLEGRGRWEANSNCPLVAQMCPGSVYKKGVCGKGLLPDLHSCAPWDTPLTVPQFTCRIQLLGVGEVVIVSIPALVSARMILTEPYRASWTPGSSLCSLEGSLWEVL